MKKIKLLFIAAMFCVYSSALFAQVEPLSGGGGVDIELHHDGPSITPEQRAAFQAEADANIAMLEAEGRLLPYTEGTSILFRWPVEQAPGFDYNSTWSISNYVDHDPASGVLEDYNCGTRTYDTASGYDHQGLDIFTWPFWWKQVDEEQTHVVAAAPGQIVFKRDGEFDRNCAFNSDPWNAVYVRHADGSVAWYGHLKNGSLTTKNIGELVDEGEYLGVIASSGNSTGPHLHFEVYDSSTLLIDPYIGPCNDLNTETWWQSQKPYINPQINAVLTHSNIPNFGTCPETETTFESDEFDPFNTVYLISYFKDQQPGTSSFNEVIDPDGSTYFSWTRNFTSFFYASWWWQSISLNDNEGTWIYRVTYNGETVDHEFTVGTLGVAENELNKVVMAPNPAYNLVNLQSVQPIQSVDIYDINGKLIQTSKANSTSFDLHLNGLQSGMYFIKVTDDVGAVQSLRLLKQ